MRTSRTVKALLAAAAAAPLLCHAESNVQTGAATANPGATAHVDFQITIPKFLYLRVGSGSAYTTGSYANNATIDQITWAPTAAQVGTGALAGTGGDLTGGVETAAIVSNSGNVTLNATTTGALSDGAGDTISYAKITTTASSNTTATVLPAPVLVDGGTSANIVINAPATKVIIEDAKWAFTYANNTSPPAGTYGGVNTNNSRVVYTATMP
jgi:hypothetical protein